MFYGHIFGEIEVIILKISKGRISKGGGGDGIEYKGDQTPLSTIGSVNVK